MQRTDERRRLVVGATALAGSLVGGLGSGCASSAPSPATGALPGAIEGLWPRSLILDLDSRWTGQRYRVLIGLPLAPPPAAGYPVLWALDGLASFPMIAIERPRTPAALDTELLRQRERRVPDGLVVGIGYASGEPFDLHARALDYTAPGDGDTGDLLSPRHGGALAFTLFLIEELRPLIAAAWPLDPARHTLFGFSYGGLFGAQLLCRAPQHFQRWWLASPSLWFRSHAALQPWGTEAAVPNFNRHPIRVQLTVGESEQFPADGVAAGRRAQLQARRMVDNVRALLSLLESRAGVEARLTVLPGRDHMDMLAHGARAVCRFAFDEPGPL